MKSSLSAAVLPASRRAWRWPRRVSAFACWSRSRIWAGEPARFAIPPPAPIVDNGQHLFMGCYHSTIQFLKTIGTLDRLHFQPRLAVPFLDRDGRLTRLDCPDLPSPWHMLIGVLRSAVFRSHKSWRFCAWGGFCAEPGGKPPLRRAQKASRRGSAAGDSRKAFSAISGICSASRP